MASDALHAELADLAGSELIARLRISTRRVDFEAVARVLDARDGRLAAAEAAVAEANKLLEARDGRLAAAEAAVAEANKLLDGRDGRLAAAEAAVAEANKLLDARDRERTQLQEALAKVEALRKKHDARGGQRSGDERGRPRSKDARGEPRSEDARPGDAIKAPAPEQRAEVPEEKRPDVIDLCSSGDEEEEREECRAGDSAVSRKRKASAPEVNGEGPRRRVSWKGNAAASAPLSDDEDDSLTLSQLMKKRGGAQPGADGEPKSTDSVRGLGDCLPQTSLVIKQEIVETTVGGSQEPNEATFVQGRGDVNSGEHGGMSRAMPSPPALSFALVNGTLKNPSWMNSAVPLGNHLPETPVIRECPEARVVQSVEPKEPTFVERMENGKSAEDVGVNRATLSPTPTGFAARTGSQKIISNGDHVEVTIAGKEGSLENDISKTPSVIMERPEARVGGSEEPKVAAFVQGRVKIKSEDDEGVSMTMLSPPPGFPARTGSHKNLSKADHGVQRIAPKIVESARADAELPKGHTVSALGDSVVLGLETNRNAMPVEGLLPSAVTRNWECDADVFISCLENKELCIQAACALYRQKKLIFQPPEGGQSGNTGFSKLDANRVAKLVEFLSDGNVYGPLKRTTEEVMKHDSTGPSFLEEVVCRFHDQLFDIYKNKEDPYFR